MRTITHFSLICVLSFGSTVTSAWAQSGSATRFVKAQHDNVRRVLDRATPTEAARERQRDEVTLILRDLLDLDTMGRQSLGRHWERLSPADRARFTSLLRQLVEQSYRENLESTQAYEIRYGSEEVQGDRTVVHTVARSVENRRAPEIAIDYWLRPEGAGFVVEDIVTDGVSLVRNYRNQFDRIIQRDGWDALLARMEQRLARGSAI